jgi:glucose/arabinose dehydrogenase
MRSRRRLLKALSGAGTLALLPAFAQPSHAQAPPAPPSQSKDLAREGTNKGFVVRTLVTGLNQPWSMAWLPTGELLVTEREGQLRRISKDFALDPAPIKGLPTVFTGGQAGLFDVVVHSRYRQNGWVYLAFAETPLSGRLAAAGTSLIRGRIAGGSLVDIERLFAMHPRSRGGRHFGGRIVLDGRGHVFLTLGDRGEEDRAQKPNDHAGAVIRLHEDGRIPQDNPFVGQTEIPSEIFSRGHRNIQGAALHPGTGELWAHEHGPQGGDELNIVRVGLNYGWPTITYGVNYVTGTRIGEGQAKAGLEQPLHIWVPSIAPSGLAFYEGEAFPQWQGSLFVGALRGQTLVRLRLQGSRVVGEERLLTQQVGRIRDVRVGTDGLVYLLTDDADGRLLRLEPQA